MAAFLNVFRIELHTAIKTESAHTSKDVIVNVVTRSNTTVIYIRSPPEFEPAGALLATAALMP